uniref:EF-hand domain-containing protein n=1 Tax=Lepeophtheirus salmonis TaxID=72036 RepID=A0A0K2UAW8_LEPSM|nr:uncharacterized protein LOC121118754 [Lepeophtheirus salmonis]
MSQRLCSSTFSSSFSWSNSVARVGIFSVLFALIILQFTTTVSGSNYEGSLRPGPRINRRGFKSSLLSTARGFGKRAEYIKPSEPEPEYEDKNVKLFNLFLKNLDNNKDGSISPEEINQVYPPPRYIYDYPNHYA